MKRNLLTLIVLLILPTLTYAGGYRVSLQGVRQAALGAQGAVLTHDASVAFFNPGALVFVDSKVSVTLGGFGAFVTSRYQNRNTLESAETNNPTGTPLYFAASYKPMDKLAVGLSVTTPFGSIADWGEEWSGRYIVSRMELRAILIQPTISYKINEWLGVGAGYIYGTGKVNVQKMVAVGGNDAKFEIKKPDASGSAFNVGVFLKPTDKINVGIAYRSKMIMKAEQGEAEFTNVPAIALGNPNAPFNAKTFDAELPLPHELIVGASYQVTPKLLILGEVASVGWEEYSSLDIRLWDNTQDVPKSYDIITNQSYEHTYNFSLGAEYAVNDKVDMRIGYKYDNTPSPDDHFSPQTPTIDYHAFTFGAGSHFGKFGIDFMAEYLKGVERSFYNIENGFGGDLNTSGYVVGLGVSYNIQNKKLDK